MLAVVLLAEAHVMQRLMQFTSILYSQSGYMLCCQFYSFPKSSIGVSYVQVEKDQMKLNL